MNTAMILFLTAACIALALAVADLNIKFQDLQKDTRMKLDLVTRGDDGDHLEVC